MASERKTYRRAMSFSYKKLCQLSIGGHNVLAKSKCALEAMFDSVTLLASYDVHVAGQSQAAPRSHLREVPAPDE